MQISASIFWEMSLYEFMRAIDGFIEFNGSSQDAPLQKDELQDLMERYPD